MAYSNFKTIEHVTDKFPITVSSGSSLFTDIAPADISRSLKEILEEYVPLALNINTEKARSEMIVIPVLIEVRKQLERQVSLFSGVDFTVDKALGLNGYCDFILSGSPDQAFITKPGICMVEAKNESIQGGYGQCMAEMIAAQRFNQGKSTSIEVIWGVVTAGDTWRFLRLEGEHVSIDYDEYNIIQIEKILGILQYILSLYLP